MRIVTVSQIYPPAANGQAVFTRQLTEGLAARGHDVLAIIPSDRWRAYREERNGVRLEALAALQMGLPDAYLTPAPLLGLHRLFEGFQPQVVHLQDHYPLSRYAFGFAHRRALPVVGTNHFIPENIAHYVVPFPLARRLSEDFLWWTMTSLYNKVDVVTTPTATAAGILEGIGLRTPVQAISCGVDLERYKPDPQLDPESIRARYGLRGQDPLFLYVGRIDEEKGLDVMLRALREVGGGAQLGITGQGRHEREIRQLVRDLGLGDRVAFTGYLPEGDLPKLVQSADIFIMPSSAELQSIATLEAMALGKPVLAAGARALPELVRPGRNGFLFRPGDPQDAARCMRQLLEMRSRWPAMGTASRRIVQSHHIENTISDYEALYQKLLSRATMENRSAQAMQTPVAGD